MHEWQDVYQWQKLPSWPGVTRIRGARLFAGYSQEELATAVGASRRTISSVERGRSTPSLALARSLARALGLTLDELFAGDDLR